MNEELILSMAQPYVKDGSITYEQFDKIYDMLSRKEQYTVTNILYKNGINLIDEAEQINEDTYILNLDESAEDFQVLYDEGLFKDSGRSGDNEESLIINRNIKQSNEILCALIQQGNKQAAQDLCIKNKRMVDKYVAAYQKKYGNRLDFEDLEQVGFMGLMRAARKFEPRQGYSFTTYAVWWIKQAISREIMENGYAIRLPIHMIERINSVTRAEWLYIDLHIKERVKKISEDLHLSEDDVRECLILRDNYLNYASLNTPIGENEDTELAEFIPEEDVLSVEDIVANNELASELSAVISTLTPKEQKVLKLRFGLEDGRARTLDEVGSYFNVTRERIRQIELKALIKLRHPSRSKRLRDYYD